MKIISLLVALCFSLNIMASTGTVAELERALDDYQYAMSVEWDQKDQNFYDTNTKDFFAKLETLIKTQGLSQAQVMTLLEKKVNNKAMLETLKLKMSLAGKATSVEDLGNLIKDATKDMYSQGADWRGEVLWSWGVGIVVVAVIAYGFWWDAHHECVAYDQQYVCNTYNNCPYGTASIGYYGTSYCGGYGGYPYSSCGYANVCTQYVEK